ncbi:hypothetical protein CBR_g24070 [Chara braunii]|uniref:Integrase catalytic domain-containing protein n=1 Tax=Chara braunii TaxID=69332 RepID=A0A388L5Q3_CHABU|nr:hypothetical protein CBR_g24070 [Chara braunii]|eukprot:GBG77624.1 hypothetical protein CBR_g24070 [Chara braunii]
MVWRSAYSGVMLGRLGSRLVRRQSRQGSSPFARRFTDSCADADASAASFLPAAGSWAAAASPATSSLRSCTFSRISRSFSSSSSSSSSSCWSSLSSFLLTSSPPTSLLQGRSASLSSSYRSSLTSSITVRRLLSSAASSPAAAYAATAAAAVPSRCGGGGTRAGATWAARQQVVSRVWARRKCGNGRSRGSASRRVRGSPGPPLRAAVNLPTAVMTFKGVREGIGYATRDGRQAVRQTCPGPILQSSLRLVRRSSGGAQTTCRARNGVRAVRTLRPPAHDQVRRCATQPMARSLAMAMTKPIKPMMMMMRTTMMERGGEVVGSERAKAVVKVFSGWRFSGWDRWSSSRDSWRRSARYGSGGNLSLRFSRGGGDDQRMVWMLIGANAAIFLIWQLGIDRRWLSRHLQVSAESVANGRFYTTLTCAFSHADLWHMVANMSGLYFFGSEIAQTYGGHFLLKLYITGGIAASLAHVAYHVYYVPWMNHAANRIFHDYLDKLVIVYLDDILIFSRTVEEHVGHLDKVLSLLWQHKFQINREKCEFGRTRILYLGHEISAKGLRPDDAKVASIRDWLRPQSVTEMKSFLGITVYYRNFVKNYSIVAAPLMDLTRLGTPWDWTNRCEAAFKSLTHHEVLKPPDLDKPFIVTMDASQYGIGAVLAQQEGPKLRPVEYMSKKIPSQKLAKSTYEKELYAIYKALTHWRHYLLGRFFYVRTDHQTLKRMRTQPVLSDVLKRWIEVVKQYDFGPQYIKGEYNKVTDALITEFGLADDVTRSLVEACHKDPFMSEIIRRLEAKDKVTSDEFVLVNGLLFLEKAGNERLCVPSRESLHSLFLGECHDATGHFGYKKTAANLLQQFWWPTMMRDAKLYVETCQLHMTSGKHPEAKRQAEQLNRAVQHLLRHYINPNLVDWDEKLALIASLYNNAVHSATGVSPNSLLLTLKPRLPLDFLLPENQPTAAPGTLEFAYRYEHLMQQAVEHMHKAQAAMIESENKHRRPSTFQVGDRVWVKASELGQEHGISRKLMPQYLGPCRGYVIQIPGFGPWEVLDVVGDDLYRPSYVIQIPGHLRTYPVFHASTLTPFKETDHFPSRRSMLPPTMDGEVDIDDIVDHREMPVPRPTGRGRPPKAKLQYRVRVRHHTEDKWFTREELMQTAPQPVAHYEKSLQKGKRQIEVLSSFCKTSTARQTHGHIFHTRGTSAVQQSER